MTAIDSYFDTISIVLNLLTALLPSIHFVAKMVIRTYIWDNFHILSLDVCLTDHCYGQDAIFGNIAQVTLIKMHKTTAKSTEDSPCSL